MVFGFGFFRLALRLTLLLVMTFLLVRLIGGVVPASLLTVVFSQPDGAPCDQPCVFGIHPGETSADEAVLLLRAHPLTRDAEWIDDNTLRLNDAGTYILLSKTRNGLVQNIVLSASLVDDGSAPAAGSLLDSIMLGDYMLVFDVTEVNIPASLYLVYLSPQRAAFAATTRPADFSQRIKANTPLANLIISAARRCPSELDFAAGGRWEGFTTIARYYAQRIFIPVVPSNLPVPPVTLCQR